MNDRKQTILILSGFSGSGKTTACNLLLEENDRYIKLKTHTTRPQRYYDENDYVFITEKQFRENLAAGLYCEYTSYANNHYGTVEKDILDNLDGGKIPILLIDFKGLLQIQEKNYIRKGEIEVVSIFLFCQPDILVKRLLKRGEENIYSRLIATVEEIEFIENYDYIIDSGVLSVEEMKDQIIKIIESPETFPEFKYGFNISLFDKMKFTKAVEDIIEKQI